MEGRDQVQAVQSEEERYRLLVDAITDYAIFMLDVDGFVTSWNPGAQRFKGYAAGEIIGEHFSRFYTEKERAAGAPNEALRKAREEGRFEREGWRVRKDGSRFWAHVVIDPVRAPSGELVGYAKITRDLTDRKRAEEALRISEQQFRLLVQGVTDYAIFMLDPDGRVTNWNVGAERIKGYAPEEIVGEHFSRFYAEEDRLAGLPAKGLETARREGRWESEGVRIRKDGSRFWAHVVIDAIRDPVSGELLGFAKVTRDITERREAQRALEEAREALFQAQKMESIGQLTGGVAHDFNNLLMAVLSSLELLKKRLPLDGKTASLLDNAMQGAQRGAALTQRMLAFARRQELKLQPIDLQLLVRNMMSFLQRSIGPSVRIEARLPRGLPPATTDSNQLETAILNLAVNARDAMPDGGVITISARREDVAVPQGDLAAGAYVVLTVADTGEGMNEDTLSRAVEPFFTTKGVGKGTGLGLSMVHGLTVQSGGRLAIRSQRGAGTVVELWLPAGEAHAEAESPDHDADADEEEGGALAPLVILAVDDDPLVLSSTTALLEDLGYQVVPAASGALALEALDRHPEIGLVISDQVMPGMTGLQLREAIRSAHPGLPMLIATGYAELPSGLEFEGARLAKPFTQHELAQAVEKAVARAPDLLGAAANHLMV